eukprot:scaffold6627_cov108-Isochrysis_galbana.AAC.2
MAGPKCWLLPFTLHTALHAPPAPYPPCGLGKPPGRFLAASFGRALRRGGGSAMPGVPAAPPVTLGKAPKPGSRPTSQPACTQSTSRPMCKARRRPPPRIWLHPLWTWPLMAEPLRASAWQIWRRGPRQPCPALPPGHAA